MLYLADAGNDGGGGGLAATLITLSPFILMFVIFYFLLIRPQQKRARTRASMLNALQKGDKVITLGGMHGTIMEINEDTVIVKVNDATKLTFERSAIDRVTDRINKS